MKTEKSVLKKLVKKQSGNGKVSKYERQAEKDLLQGSIILGP